MLKNRIKNNDVKISPQNIVTIFVIAAMAGWIYETVLEVFVWKTGFSNRGFLYGPYLPVYGFGTLAFLPGALWISRQRFPKALKVLLMILLCAIVATAIELATSYLLEVFTGGWLWDYSERYHYHFQGRIALDTSLRFGVGGACLVYLISYIMDTFIYDRPKIQNIFCGIAVIMGIDLVFTLLLR